MNPSNGVSAAAGAAGDGGGGRQSSAGDAAAGPGQPDTNGRDPSVETQLLFFDTFSHDAAEDLNLDLVQFPSPVVVEEIRVIPLGARVQANFPGGMRLGATNPTQFQLEFFVNDLGKPGAATFETLGTLPYCQHQRINLQTTKTIPTDGLVLRGMYNAITLAIYGTLSKSTAEQLASQAERLSENNSNPPNRATPGEQRVDGQAAAADARKDDETGRGLAARVSSEDLFSSERAGRSSQQPAAVNGKDSEEDRQSSVRSHDRSRSPLSDAGYGRHGGGGGSPGRMGSRTPSERHSSASRHSPLSREDSVPREAREAAVTQTATRSAPPQSDLFEEMSDISEGDIPMSDFEDDDKEQGGQEGPAGGKGAEEATPSFPRAIDASGRPSGEDKASVQPEDMEEISDEEAEWSDDGMDLQVDFGEEWEEPVKIFDFESVEILEEPAPRLSARAAAELAERLGSVPPCDSQEWIDFAEGLSEVLEGEALSEDEASAHRDALLALVSGALDGEAPYRHKQATDSVRHIKSGLKLVRTLVRCSRELTREMLKIGLQKRVLEIVTDKSLVSYAIKLQALRTLDDSLCLSLGLGEGAPQGGETYKQLMALYAEASSTRVKQAVRPIVNKINFYELVDSFCGGVEDLSSESETVPGEQQCETLVRLGGKIADLLASAPGHLAQPRKLLPVRFNRCADEAEWYEDPYPFVFDVFASCSLLESLYALLAKSEVPAVVFKTACQLLELLTESRGGPKYLCRRGKTSNSLIRCLIALSNARDVATCVPLNPVIIKLSVAVHAHQSLKQLEALARSGPAEEDMSASVDILQTLFGMTYCAAGRKALSRLFLNHGYLKLLVRLACLESEDEGESNFSREAIRGYSIELTLIVLRTSESPEDFFADIPALQELAKRQADSEGTKAGELAAWVKPLQDAHNLPNLCDLAKKNIEGVNPVSLELVMTARLIHFHCKQDGEGGEEGLNLHRQRQSVITLHSHGLLDHYLAILGKACDAHDHPYLHGATFCGEEGFLLLSALKPIVHAFKIILRFAVGTRSEAYRDTCCVGPLVRTFMLTEAVPTAASSIKKLARQIGDDVVDILANLTVPTFDAAAAKGGVAQSCWTVMMGELLDLTVSVPHVFSSGLSLINRLLPLPLPVVAGPDQQSGEVAGQVARGRKLWSAHLVPVHKKVRAVIRQMIGVRDGRLLAQLAEFCLRVADLSGPTSLLVAEECLGAFTEAEKDGNVTPLWVITALLKKHSVRRAFLKILMGDDEKAADFLSGLARVLTESEGPTPAAKEKVFSILRDFFDPVSPSRDLPAGFPVAKFSSSVLRPVLGLPGREEADPSIHQPCLQLLSKVASTDLGRLCLLEAARAAPHALGHLTEKVLALAEPSQFSEASRTLLDLIGGLQGTFTTEEEDGGSAEAGQEVTSSFEHLLQQSNSASPHPLTLVKERLEQEEGPSEVIAKVQEALRFLNEKPAATWDEFARRMSQREQEEDGAETSVFALEPAPRGLDPGDLGDGLDKVDGSSRVVDLMAVSGGCIKGDFSLPGAVKEACSENLMVDRGEARTARLGKESPGKKSILERKAMQNKNIISSFRAGGSFSIRGMRGFSRMGAPRPDGFRSRPPNTSRPPSLHVDDFLLLQSRGQQPTGPTGYNKQSIKAAKELFAQREAHQQGNSIVGFREATSEPVFDDGSRLGGGLAGVGRRGGGLGGGVGPGKIGGGFRGGGRGMPAGGGGDRGWPPMAVGELERRKWIPPGGLGVPERGGLMKDRRKGGDGRPRHLRAPLTR